MGQQDIFFPNESSKSHQEFPPLPLLLAAAVPGLAPMLVGTPTRGAAALRPSHRQRGDGDGLYGVSSGRCVLEILRFSKSGWFCPQEK